MPRDSNGTMTAPAGQPVVGGTPALASVFNVLVADLVAELTDSLSRSGKGGMLAPFEFSDGTVGDPSATFVNNPTCGLYRAGAGDIRLSHLGVDMAVFTTALLKLIGHCVDGATAVGITLDTVNALTTSGAKLLSVLNHAVEKFYVDKDGAVSAGSTIAAGNGLFAANGAVGATLLGNIADGATAVGIILDCVNALSTSGAKTLSIRNAGVEKASIDKDGLIAGSDITVTGGIAKTRLASLGQQLSSSCGEFFTSSATYEDVTNLSVTITTTGRPIFVALIHDGDTADTHEARIGVVGAPPGFLDQRTRFVRGSTQIAAFRTRSAAASYLNYGFTMMHIDVVAAGTYTYKVQIRDVSGSYVAGLLFFKLIAFEL